MDKYVIQVLNKNTKLWEDTVPGRDPDEDSIGRVTQEKISWERHNPKETYRVVERKTTDTVIKEEKTKSLECPFGEFIDDDSNSSDEGCPYREDTGCCEDGDIIINAGNSDSFCNQVMTHFFADFGGFEEIERQEILKLNGYSCTSKLQCKFKHYKHTEY